MKNSQMKIRETTKFSLQVLHKFTYSESTDSVVLTGAMSPVLAATTVADIMMKPVIGIVRIHFKDENGYHNEKMYNEYDPYPDLTGYDHLIVMLPHCFLLCVDRGADIRLISMVIYDDTMFEIQEHNNEMLFAERLSDQALTNLLTELVPHIRVYNEEARLAYQKAKTFIKEDGDDL